MSQDIIPSFLHDPTNPSSYHDGNMFSNTVFRQGEVVEIVEPEDPRNINKRFKEYRCFVQHTSNGTASTYIYEHCLLLNAFAGLADYLDFTLRADDVAKKKERNVGPGLGSKVAILCMNGQTHSAIIIGGLRDAKDTRDEKGKSKAKGHHLDFEFNGLAVSINNDGEMTMTQKGATKNDGTPRGDVDSANAGTQVKVEKNGNFSVTTKGGQKLTLDQKNKKITIDADTEYNVVCKGTVNIKAKKAVIDASKIELGGSGLSTVPSNGLVHGSWVEPLSGLPVWMLGGTSHTVFGKK
jgi:hypothetical protein